MPLAPFAQKTTRARKEHHHGGHCHRQRAAPRPSCSPALLFPASRPLWPGHVFATRGASLPPAPPRLSPPPAHPHRALAARPLAAAPRSAPTAAPPPPPPALAARAHSSAPPLPPDSARVACRSLHRWPERGQRRCGASLRAAARRRSCLARVYLLKLYRLHRCTGGTARGKRRGRLSPRASCPATAHSSRST